MYVMLGQNAPDATQTHARACTDGSCSSAVLSVLMQKASLMIGEWMSESLSVGVVQMRSGVSVSVNGVDHPSVDVYVMQMVLACLSG